jgi:hypothetical protein
MTDFLDRLEHQLVTVAASPAVTARPRVRNARRLTPLAAAAVALLAGGAVALGASGLLTGSPVKPTGPLNPTVGAGLPARGGSRLLALRAVDPAGGPAWGVRIVDTTRGLVCLQVGRVQNGQLGELGIDGAFHNDGRFHPMPADVLPQSDDFGSNPACVLPNQTFTSTLFDFDRDAVAPNGRPVLARDQREIAFGLLGPHALSVTYATAHGPHTERVDPITGAYLFVERPVKPGEQFSTGSGGLEERNGPRPQPTGAVTAITYRFGNLVCSDSRDLHGPNACPQPPRPAREPGGRQLNLHRPLHVTLQISHGVVYSAKLSFTAPYAVTSARESYDIEQPLGHDCRGGGIVYGAVDRDIARDSTVRVSLPDVFANTCNRSQTIKVLLSRTPTTVQPSTSTVIGTITIHEPPGTHAAVLPHRRRPR